MEPTTINTGRQGENTPNNENHEESTPAPVASSSNAMQPSRYSRSRLEVIDNSITLPPSTSAPAVDSTNNIEKRASESKEETIGRFTCYPKLPLELRELVLDESFPEERIIGLCGRPWTIESVTPGGELNSITHANSEIRKHILKQYTLLASEDLMNKPVWARLDHDIILLSLDHYFASWDVVLGIPDAKRSLIKRLALEG
ncbi:hypothetical protein BJ875DRAFT_509955 [Amylocarpus encephaloides]|uniref:2EXR domain-containing protein n=1 Tax=Amylocarpus encephaloides TaxID=45428 RepID=A0A9P8C5K0_9HELO|nr:hypothetical protein BJ875DRAFT_509955 [Amylocarpus encephaloides]